MSYNTLRDIVSNGYLKLEPVKHVLNTMVSMEPDHGYLSAYHISLYSGLRYSEVRDILDTLVQLKLVSCVNKVSKHMRLVLNTLVDDGLIHAKHWSDIHWVRNLDYYKPTTLGLNIPRSTHDSKVEFDGILNGYADTIALHILDEITHQHDHDALMDDIYRKSGGLDYVNAVTMLIYLEAIEVSSYTEDLPPPAGYLNHLRSWLRNDDTTRRRLVLTPTHTGNLLWQQLRECYPS